MGERVGRWVRWSVLALVPSLSLYYLVFAGEYGAFDIRELETARAEAVRRVDSLQAVVDSLSARADSLARDTLAIERLARERYGFVREGERLYRFVPAQEADRAEPGSRGGVDASGGAH